MGNILLLMENFMITFTTSWFILFAYQLSTTQWCISTGTFWSLQTREHIWKLIFLCCLLWVLLRKVWQSPGFVKVSHLFGNQFCIFTRDIWLLKVKKKDGVISYFTLCSLYTFWLGFFKLWDTQFLRVI